MFFRTRLSILVLLLAATSTVTWAGVTQSARFTLSVTIPERAQTPSASSPLITAPSNVASAPRMDMHSEMRGQSLVFVISYVVD